MNTSSPPAANQARRRLLFGGVAGAAAAAGAGFAWFKLRPQESEGAAAALWPLSFQTPAGETLEMKALRGKPLLVNFWATWCAPCIEEMPLLDEFYRQNASKGWQVVGLAIDQPSAVRTFLARLPVSFPIGMAGLGGTELSRALGNRVGGLPYSVVVSGAGKVVQRRMGRVTAADLALWARLG